jgi:hypothetical protein
MGTFSIYDGTDKETISYFLGGSYSQGSILVDDVLLTLKDNTTKLVFERDIRNAVFSLASSFIFKETIATQSTTSYIGIDNLNIGLTTSAVSLRDIKGYKFLMGKRSYSGTYSYQATHDIFHIASTYSLLSTDVDFFFYNTKVDVNSDAISNNVTKLSILSGTDFQNFQIGSPYIQSQIIETGFIDTPSLDFISRGDLSVSLNYGTVSIYNPTNPSYSINFPNYAKSVASASTNKVLKWGSGEMYWEEIQFPATDHIGITGSELKIIGSDVLVNGTTLEFTDTRKVPFSFNQVLSGQTFSEYPLNDLLRRLIYPYLKPEVSISLLDPYTSGYSEVGMSPQPIISYRINKKTENTGPAVLENMIPGFYPGIVSNKYETVESTSNGIVISPIQKDTTVFKITVSDGFNTVSSTASLTGIYPYFWGFSDLLNMTNIGLDPLTKTIEPKSDKVVDVVGTGNFYFIYDYDYGTISNIYDDYGNTCSASFSRVEQVFASPTGLWAGKKFWVYKWLSATMSPPSKNFEFKY